MKRWLGPSVKFDLPPRRLRAVWEAGSSLSPASWHSKSDTASERGWHYSSSECGDPDETCPPARPTQTRSQVQTLASQLLLHALPERLLQVQCTSICIILPGHDLCRPGHQQACCSQGPQQTLVLVADCRGACMWDQPHSPA